MRQKEKAAMITGDTVLTFSDLKTRKHWPYSRETTWRMVKEGRFPKPFKMEGGVRNLWLESTVDKFLADRANDRPEGR